jgi:hypothetical protein
MAARRSSEQWAAIVAAFEETSEPVERFCARRKLQPATFRWWRWRLRKSTAAAEGATATSDEVRLIPVDVVGLSARRSASAPVEIAFADVAVRVEPGTDIAYVASLVAELRSRC